MRLALRTLCAFVGGAAVAAAVHAQAPSAATTAAGSGPYPALMEADAGLTTHMVYRPRDLAVLGERKMPIVVWGNGACVNAGNAFRPFLTEIASYGFLAVAIGPLGPERAVANQPPAAGPAPAAPAPRGQGAPALPPAATKASQLIDAINWAIAENGRKGSRYFGKLDTSKIAAMGMSCGGLQAIDAAHDPRVTTLGVWNSGVIANGPDPRVFAGAEATKESLQTLRVPAIYVSGDPSDIAFPNAEDDFARLSHIPVFRAWREKTGHGGTYHEPNGGAFGRVAVAWLRFQLQGDTRAATMFVGANCGLCGNPEWHVSKKGIDTMKTGAQPPAPGLAFAFELRATVAAPTVLGQVPNGTRRIVDITGGTFEGPGIKGMVRPGGADWQIVRADGFTELDTRYTIETDKGQLVYVQNAGMRHAPPDVMQKLLAGQPVDPTLVYFRTIPKFETSAPELQWLTRAVFIGTGERYPTEVVVRFWRVQ
jgi:dienelactone hydrolase